MVERCDHHVPTGVWKKVEQCKGGFSSGYHKVRFIVMFFQCIAKYTALIVTHRALDVFHAPG
jgi:hypothetical protein